MAKRYKIWVQIEEYDTETGVDRDLCDYGEVEPVKIATFGSLPCAIQHIEQLANASEDLHCCSQDTLHGQSAGAGATIDPGPIHSPSLEEKRRSRAVQRLIEACESDEIESSRVYIRPRKEG